MSSGEGGDLRVRVTTSLKTVPAGAWNACANPGALGEALGLSCQPVAAGLDRDFRGEPFGPMPLLLCLAEFVDKLQAVCHQCGGAATRTQRLVDGEPAPFDGATIQIGALDSYEARCSTCYRAGVTVALGAVG